MTTSQENAQYDAALAKVDHEDHFDQGYVDGLAAAYDQHDAGQAHAPINSRRDLAGAILALPDTPNKTAAVKHITSRARALHATDLLPKAWKVAA